MKQGPRPPGELFWFEISCSLRSADETCSPRKPLDPTLMFVWLKEIGKQMNETQKHRLCQQHTFATVSSVITDSQLLIIHIEHVIFPQIRFVMKSYSFIRETAPLVMNNPPKEGTGHFWWQIIWAQNCISQLCVCVCLFVLRRKSQIPNTVQLSVLPVLPNVDLQGIISPVGYLGPPPPCARFIVFIS